MTSPVFSTKDQKGFPMAPEAGSDNFGCEVTPIGQQIGLRGLGMMLTQVEPGKRAFPFHNHLGNDEAFVILEGEGTYRLGEGEFPVTAGDVCGAPRGGPETAHQLINTGDSTLKYIGISTMRDPEVVEYPDSKKFSAIAVKPGKDFMSAHLKFVGRVEDGKDYWDGEEV